MIVIGGASDTLHKLPERFVRQKTPNVSDSTGRTARHRRDCYRTRYLEEWGTRDRPHRKWELCMSVLPASVSVLRVFSKGF